MGVYSSVFFFLTGLHFFHLVVGLLLLSLLSWSSSFSFGKKEDLGEGEAKRRRRLTSESESQTTRWDCNSNFYNVNDSWEEIRINNPRSCLPALKANSF